MKNSNSKKNIQISIITPSFNQGEFIEDTFKSILSQNLGSKLEYIVVDNLSSDHTPDVIEVYRKKFKKQGIEFKLIREKDRGQADALNKGFKIASGEILGYLNSDDYFLPNKLSKVINYFYLNPNILWALGGWQYVDSKRKIYKQVFTKRFQKNKLLYYCNIGQPSCFFQKKLLTKVGYFNINLHLALDYDLWLRFLQIANPGIIPNIISNMRLHTKAKSSSTSIKQLNESWNIAKEYTPTFSFQRLMQLIYYLRGVVLVLFSFDIHNRVQKKSTLLKVIFDKF